MILADEHDVFLTFNVETGDAIRPPEGGGWWLHSVHAQPEGATTNGGIWMVWVRTKPKEES